MSAAKVSFRTMSLEERLREAERIRTKYPDRVPIIVEKANTKNAKDLPDIDKQKFLVPSDLSIGQFIYIIRKRIKLNHEQAIFLFVGDNMMPPATALMATLYEEYKSKDGFLYAVYASESTFG